MLAFSSIARLTNQKLMKLILAAVCLCLLAYQPCPAQPPSEEEFDWVGERFFPVFEELFPIEEGLGYSLGYRSYRDLYTDELEYSFVFNRDPRNQDLTAVLRIADSASIYDQIMNLHRKDKTASIDAIKPKLKVKEWRFSDKTCPTVRRQYDEFYRLSLQTLSAKDRAEQAKGVATIILHPRVHIIKADISGGDVRMVLSDPQHPFVRWAERTKRALEKCVVKQN